MTTLELEHRKQNLIEVLTSFDNEEAVAQVEQLVASLKNSLHKATPCPCAFTTEEMREQLAQSKEEFRQGNYYTEEQANALFNSWIR